jgi:hypothetical protein
MSKESPPDLNDDLRPEYNFDEMQGRVQGKYYERYKARMPMVRLAPDVAAAFPSEEAVNTALRLLIQLAKQQVKEPAA